MNTKELLELKEEVDNEKRKIQEKKGQLKLLQSRLKEEFNCNNIEEAQKNLSKLEEQLQDLEDKKKEKIEKIQELYKIK